MYLIDQHAAHERLIYDKLQAESQRGEIAVQPLLLPFMLHANPSEYNLLAEHLVSFTELGFDIEPISGAFKVSSVPLLLSEIDLQAFFDSALYDIFKGRAIKGGGDYIKEKLSQKACKSAVKAGDKLSETEVKALLYRLETENTELLCPHGRPILLRYTKRDIEKLFKRIV